MDKRLYKLTTVLAQIAKNDFDHQLPISDKRDMIDGISAGINIMANELKATTMPLNYFRQIFNTIPDLMIVLDKKGSIEDLNDAVYREIGYTREDLLGKTIHVLQPKGRKSFLHLLNLARIKNEDLEMDTYLLTKWGMQCPVHLSIGPVDMPNIRKSYFLITAVNNTQLLRMENTAIRAMINAQEEERERISRDIHDSLGQVISCNQSYLSSIINNCKDNALKKRIGYLKKSISDLVPTAHSICLNLMPTSMADFGLQHAVVDFCSQADFKGIISFKRNIDENFPDLNKNLQIDLFRVIQEFVGNALKHGNASKVSITFKHDEDLIFMVLKENGIGFNPDKIVTHGRGLQNVRSRIQSHHGDISIESIPQKGTTYHIMVPLNEENICV